MAQATKNMQVQAGNANANVTAVVTDSMPGVPCPGPGGYRYKGLRYVPKFADPAEWSAANSYEALTVVLNQGNSYTSKQAVPAGVDIYNEAYWALTGNFNAQLAQCLASLRKLEADSQWTGATLGLLGAVEGTDVTQILNEAFANGYDNIYIDGAYLVNGALSLPTKLKLSGGKLTVMPDCIKSSSTDLLVLSGVEITSSYDTRAAADMNETTKTDPKGYNLNAALVSITNGRCYIENCKFSGSYTGFYSNVCNVSAVNSSFTRSAQKCCSVANGQGFFMNCEFGDANTANTAHPYAVYGLQCTSGKAYDGRVEAIGCWFHDVPMWDGFMTHGASNVLISACLFENCRNGVDAGVIDSASMVENVVVSDCVFEGATTNPWSVAGYETANNSAVIGGSVVGVTCRNYTVKNIVASGFGAYTGANGNGTILLNNVDGISIEGCRLTETSNGTTEGCVQLGSGCKNIWIAENVMNGKTGIMVNRTTVDSFTVKDNVGSYTNILRTYEGSVTNGVVDGNVNNKSVAINGGAFNGSTLSSNYLFADRNFNTALVAVSATVPAKGSAAIQADANLEAPVHVMYASMQPGAPVGLGVSATKQSSGKAGIIFVNATANAITVNGNVLLTWW